MTVPRSASDSLAASPSTPRIVIPSTPQPATNRVSVGRLASSSEPSSRNGVGTMFQTPARRSAAASRGRRSSSGHRYADSRVIDQAARDRATRPSPATQTPGPLVKTSAGDAELEGPDERELDHPPAEADPAGDREDRERQPAVEPERPVDRPRTGARRARASRCRRGTRGSRLPAKPLPDWAGMPGVPPTCHHGRTQPTTMSAPASGGERPAATERPPVQGHPAAASV